MDWDIDCQFHNPITRLPDYQIHDRVCRDLRPVDARPFGWRRLREERLDRIRPSVEVLLLTELRHDMKALEHHAVRANVAASVNHLRSGSPILERLIHDEGLRVIGAEYSVETGRVEFFADA